VTFQMPTIPRVEFVKENCPECFAQCGWCAGNVLMMRDSGCCTIYPKKGKCKGGEAVKGTTCATCDGSTKVQVRREILPYSAVETPVVPDGDRCDRCGIWLPPVAEWSMPSCPDCVEAFEADELKPPLDKPHRHF
jgi:hypothetical protein